MNLATYILDHSELNFYKNKEDLTAFTYNVTDEKTESFMQDLAVSENKESIDARETFMQNLEERNSKKNINFKFSFDELNFQNKEEAVEKLETVIREISKLEFDISYNRNWEKNVKLTGNQEEDQEKMEKVEKKLEEKNIKIISKDIGKNKKGETVMKYQVEKRYAKFSNFDKSLFSIHTEGKNTSKGVKPHIHIVSPRKYFGKNNSLLKKEISRICKENKIISSLNTQVKHKGLLLDKSNEYRVLKDRLSNFSWVVAKHQDPKYIIQQFSKIERIQSKDKNIVTLKNVEDKLNKFLNYGGSYSFALKLQEDVKNKLGIDLTVNTPKEYLEAEKLIETSDYDKIGNYIKDKVMAGEKVSEKFREFANEHKNSPDERKILSDYIKNQFVNSGFTYNDKFQKVIDRNEVKNTHKEFNQEIKELARDREIVSFELIYDAKEYTHEKELKIDMKKHGISKEELQKITGKTIPQIIFNGIESTVNSSDLDKVLDKKEYMQRFENVDFKVNDKWKEQLFQNAMKEYVKDNNMTTLEPNEKVFLEKISFSGYTSKADILKEMADYSINPKDFERITDTTIDRKILGTMDDIINRGDLHDVFDKKEYMQRFENIDFKVSENQKEQLFYKAMEEFVFENFLTSSKPNEEIFLEKVHSKNYTDKSILVQDMKDYNIPAKDFERIIEKTPDQIVFEGMENVVNKSDLKNVLVKEVYMKRFEEVDFKVNNKLKEEFFKIAVDKFSTTLRNENNGDLKPNELVFHRTITTKCFQDKILILKEMADYKINPKDFERIVENNMQTYIQENKINYIERNIKVIYIGDIGNRKETKEGLNHFMKMNKISLPGVEKDRIIEKVIDKAIADELKPQNEAVKELESKVEVLLNKNIERTPSTDLSELETLKEDIKFVKNEVPEIVRPIEIRRGQREFNNIKKQITEIQNKQNKITYRFASSETKHDDTKNLNYLQDRSDLFSREFKCYDKLEQIPSGSNLHELSVNVNCKIKDIKKEEQKTIDEAKGYKLLTFENSSGEKVFVKEQFQDGKKQVWAGTEENVFDNRPSKIFKELKKAVIFYTVKDFELKESFQKDEKGEILTESYDKKYNIDLKKEVEELRQKEIKQAKEVKIERSGRGRGR